MLEGIHGGVKYMGRKGEFGECKRGNQRIQKGILIRYRRCGKTRMQGRNVQKRRVARKIYGKEIIWIVGQKVQSRILGWARKELEMIERETSRREKNGNDCKRRRS